MTVTQLVDAASFDKAQKLDNEIREAPHLIRPEYLKQKGWSAIVLPDNAFDEPAPALLPTMLEWEKEGFFVILEGVGGGKEFWDEHKKTIMPTGDIREVKWFELARFLDEHKGALDWCYSLGASREDLLAFNKEYRFLYNLILPNSESFALVNASNDFHILAGSREFLESALGSTVEAAWARVRATDDKFWLEWYGPHLDKYEGLSQA